MNYLELIQKKIRIYIHRVDTGNAILLFCVSALAVFVLCLIASPTIREAWNQKQDQHHQNPRGTSSDAGQRRSIPQQIKSGLKRKRRFAKNDIRAMEMEEKQRRKEEKKEEAKAERVKQKQAESGQQKQKQKTAFKKSGSGNSVENSGRSNRQKQTGVRNIRQKRS